MTDLFTRRGANTFALLLSLIVLLAAASLGLAAPEIISVGDRYEVDIEPALVLGMGGILVDGVEDVYRLPSFFEPKNNM